MPSVRRHLWIGSKGNQLECWHVVVWWWFDWSFAYCRVLFVSTTTFLYPLPPDRPLRNVFRSRGHDFELPRCSLKLHKRYLSLLTVCLNLLICELAFTYIYFVSCNLAAYAFVMCKYKGYLLTYFGQSVDAMKYRMVRCSLLLNRPHWRRW